MANFPWFAGLMDEESKTDEFFDGLDGMSLVSQRK
jgi:hypothetical protein